MASSMNLSLLKLCLIMFGWVGVNPEKGYTKTQTFLFITTFASQWSIIYLTILYLVYKEDGIIMSDITAALESVFITFHGIVKLTILFAKRKEFRDLLERMDSFWKIEDVVDEAERIEHQRYLRFIKTVFFMYKALCISTTFSFTCRTFFVEGDNLTFTTYKPDWIPFHAMLFYQGMVFLFGIYFPIPGLDMFILTLMLLTKMQFKLLNQEIARVFNEAAKPGENDKDFNKKIKKIVDYHNFLLDYIKRLNNLFSEGMLVYVITIVLSMCVEMYIVSTQKSLKASMKAVIYVINGLSQYIICYCLPAQAVTDESDRTMDCVYFSKWYEHPTPSMKVAQTMIIGRTQKKTLILAGGFIKVDLETCLKTIKTMVSYAMFIRTMGIGNK